MFDILNLNLGINKQQNVCILTNFSWRHLSIRISTDDPPQSTSSRRSLPSRRCISLMFYIYIYLQWFHRRDREFQCYCS